MHGCPFVLRDLHREVGRRAEPVDTEAPAGPQRRSAKGSVADDAGAEQRCRFGIGEDIRQAVYVLLVGDGKFRIASVGVPAGELRPDAEVLVAALTEPADAARPAQPRDSNSLSDTEPLRP